MAPRRRIPKGRPDRAVAYIRCSTEDQAHSPAAQRAAIERWANSAGATVAAWFCDLAVSGTTPAADRPGLLSALTALADVGAGHLVVARRDRLARDVVEAGTIEREVRRVGAAVTCADGVGNGDNPADQLMRTMCDAVAQFELSLIRQRTKAALAAKHAKGERTGTVPYGCRVGADGRSLEPEPAEQAVIARALALRAAGSTHREIVRTLAAEGHHSRSGRPIGLSQVQRMLARKGG